MLATTGKSLSEYLEEIESQFGRYFSDRTGIEIPRESFGPHLKETISSIANLFKSGDEIQIGKTKKTIASIITVDGIKIIFTDNSWLMIRPSGTEPKIRIYVEANSIQEKNLLMDEAKILINRLCTEGISCMR
jgi:phosphomannomutase